MGILSKELLTWRHLSACWQVQPWPSFSHASAYLLPGERREDWVRECRRKVYIGRPKRITYIKMPNENQYFVYIKKLNGKTRLIDLPCVHCFTAAVESKAL